MSTCALDCGRKLLPHSRLKTCARCRAVMGRWLKAPLSAFKSYTATVQLRGRRLANMAGHKRGIW